jgi:hypothetical protein
MSTEIKPRPGSMGNFLLVASALLIVLILISGAAWFMSDRQLPTWLVGLQSAVTTATDTPIAPAEAPPSHESAVAYANAAHGLIEDIIQAIQEMSQIVNNLQPEDQEWVLGISAHLDALNVAHEQIGQIQPPAEFADLHVRLTKTSSECHAQTELITTGINNQDITLIQIGVHQLNYCMGLFDKTVAQLASVIQP